MPPSSAAPTLARRVLAAVALTAALGLGGGVPAAAQVPTTTGVLVPGPSTATTVPATTAPPATETTAEDEGGVLDFDFDANEKVWIIVGALVAVALLLLVLTIVYWRHTKPDRSVAVATSSDRATRKEEKRRRKADAKDPLREDDGDGEVPRDPTGPLDLEELLGTPDPGRSVFGPSDEPGESPR